MGKERKWKEAKRLMKMGREKATASGARKLISS
jgi:hypothetical protein